jgi:hypothetical protein
MPEYGQVTHSKNEVMFVKIPPYSNQNSLQIVFNFEGKKFSEKPKMRFFVLFQNAIFEIFKVFSLKNARYHKLVLLELV